MQTVPVPTIAAVVLAVWSAAWPVAASADALLAARGIRAGTVLAEGDIIVDDTDADGALTDLREAVGMQARRNLYPGRPITRDDVQRPYIVERNQDVTIHFNNGTLSIVTEGRALDSGAPGDMIRVLNASSRKTVTGTVLEDGSISVTGGS